ncbi:MAG: hypothetical protein ABSD44_06885 [Terracidiphilus sp.]
MRILPALVLLGVTSIAYSQTAKQPFTITISTAKPEVKSGDPVYVEGVMTNISDHDVDCTRNWSNALDINYGYNVTDEDGQAVPKIRRKYPEIGEETNISPCIIKPGETSRASGGMISILYDFRRPGKYTIQASRPVWGDNNRPGTAGTGDDNQADVKSNILTITVVGPEALPTELK